jgi:glycine cleavage system transcriptional repressor
MQNYLVLSALGSDQQGILSELAKLAADSGCNIVDSQITVLGGEFSIIMLLGGEWNAIAKIEHTIPVVAQKFGFTTMLKRTTKDDSRQDLMPYTVDIVALDSPGIVKDIGAFFTESEINIEEMTSHTYQAPYTQAPMVSISIIVNMPASVRIGEFKNKFEEFCDSHNLDASLEPIRY